MVKEACIVLWITLSIVFITYVVLILKYFIERRLDRKWANSLSRDALTATDEQLSECIRNAGITINDFSRIEDVINQQSYAVRETYFLPFREAYTTMVPRKEVVVRRNLSPERRHFALVHELMHIIYKPEALLAQQQGRGIHHIFIRRDPEEQKRDYMAASLILPKESVLKELEESGYFVLPKDGKKEIIYMIARKYVVEPSMVARRIQEVKVLIRT